MALMVYVDETGDTGQPSLKGASSCYALGCLMVPIDRWTDSFDQVLALRRRLNASMGIPVRAELKANYLIRGHGPLKASGLSPSQRGYIYREHLKAVDGMNAQAFAVVTDKARSGMNGEACFEATWEMLLQRLERRTRDSGEHVLLFHDHGEDARIRALARRSRRYLTAGSFAGSGHYSMAFDRLIEDPIPKDSQQSYFVQLADLIAYAGWRTYMHPSAAVRAVVSESMWTNLGSAIATSVNSLKLNGSVPGVVLRTK